MITAEQVRQARRCCANDVLSYSQRLYFAGIRSVSRITTEKKEWLSANAHLCTAKEAAVHMNCCINTVRLHVGRMGLTLKAGVPHNHERKKQHGQTNS
jgi:hypothetical protein